MTYTTGETVISPPLLGVDHTAVRDNDNPEFKLGTKIDVVDTSNSYNKTFRYVQFSAACDASKVYEITEDWAVTDLLTTTTDADSPLKLGVLESAVSAPTSTYSYGWIQTAGNFEAVYCAASCAANVELYSTATGGILDDTATVLVQGIKNVGSAIGAGAAATTECFSGCEIYIATE